MSRPSSQGIWPKAARRVDSQGELSARPAGLGYTFGALVFLTGIEAVNELFGVGGPSAIYQTWFHDLIIAAAAVLILARAAYEPTTRTAWLAFGLAMTFWSVGSISWSLVYGGQSIAPYPTFADVLWLLWYPLMAVGITLLIRVHLPRFELHRWMDGLAVTLLALAAGFALIIQPVAERAVQGALATVVDFSYPVLDVLLMGALLGVYGLLGWRPDRMWTLIGVGVLATTIGDATFAIQEARGGGGRRTLRLRLDLGGVVHRRCGLGHGSRGGRRSCCGHRPAGGDAAPRGPGHRGRDPDLRPVRRFGPERADRHVGCPRGDIGADHSEPPSAGRFVNSKQYQAELERLQVELAKLQHWVQASGARIVVLFEGRDAAGKGGAIKRITERMNPRVCKVVALAAPNEQERTQWYFQRYVANLPSAGQIVLFDRSWYNRAGVERVMGFCTEDELREFLRSCPEFERMLIRSGIQLVKYWFSVSDEEQERRLQSRLADPTRRWKLSPMDLEGAPALGRVLTGQRRDVHLHRHQAIALVRGAFRRQEGGTTQLHSPPPEHHPLHRSRTADSGRARARGRWVPATSARRSRNRPTSPRSTPDRTTARERTSRHGAMRLEGDVGPPQSFEHPVLSPVGQRCEQQGVEGEPEAQPHQDPATGVEDQIGVPGGVRRCSP
jgi:polyphosphate kinase 2